MDILFIKQGHAGFINKDEAILSTLAPTKVISPYKLSRISRICLTIWTGILLVLRIWRPKVVVLHFANWIAGFYTLLSKLCSYKTVLFICGVDVTINPITGHGIHLQDTVGKRLSTYALYHADWLLPKAMGLVYHKNVFSGQTWEEGILHWAPNTKAQIEVIPNGYDPDFWTPDTGLAEPFVLCVGYAKNKSKVLRKGIDIYFDIARMLPETKFIVIGTDATILAEAGLVPPANVTVVPPQSKTELKSWYQRAHTFCLFSRNEGMPNVLSEAMLCGCFPVTSNVNGIPEVTQHLGKTFNSFQDTEEMAHCISNVLQIPKSTFANIMHDHIAHNFSLSKRKDKITHLVCSILDGQNMTLPMSKTK